MATTAEKKTAPEALVTKIFELIESGPRVQFFRTLEDGSRMPVQNYDEYTPHMVYTFTDNDGNSRTIRFLKASNDIDMEKQVKAGFLDNLKITEADRSELRFKKGKLISNKKNVLAFLAAAPSNENFEGDRGDYQVIFREFKPEVGRKNNADLALKQARAIVALEDFSNEQMDNKLLKINGSAYALPESIEEKKEALLDIINEVSANDLTVLETILEKEKGTDDLQVLLGKAINKKVISFIEVPGQIMLKRNGKFEKLLQVSEDHSEEQKIALFTDTLRTEEGKINVTAIKEALAAAEK